MSEAHCGARVLFADGAVLTKARGMERRAAVHYANRVVEDPLGIEAVGKPWRLGDRMNSTRDHGQDRRFREG